MAQKHTHLHPTMYLLIPNDEYENDYIALFTSHYVSINSASAIAFPTCSNAFTSHYVSINSGNMLYT